MNFLALAKKLADRADVPYSGFTDVESVTGELALVVDWIAQVCIDIQAMRRRRWKFLHTEYSRNTRATKSLDADVAVDKGDGTVGIPITAHAFLEDDYVTLSGTTNYDGTYSAEAATSTNELVITATYVAETFTAAQKASVRDYEFYTADGVQEFDEDSFFYYLKSDGANAKRKLRFEKYSDFRAKVRDYSADGPPSVVTITPNNRLRFYPMLDGIYVIGADAFLKSQELTANADTPPWPEDLHMLCVWKALIDYAGFEESGAIYQYATNRHDEMMDQLLWRCKWEELEDHAVRAE